MIDTPTIHHPKTNTGRSPISMEISGHEPMVVLKRLEAAGKRQQGERGARGKPQPFTLPYSEYHQIFSPANTQSPISAICISEGTMDRASRDTISDDSDELVPPTVQYQEGKHNNPHFCICAQMAKLPSTTSPIPTLHVISRQCTNH